MSKTITLLLDLSLPGGRIAIRDEDHMVAREEFAGKSYGSDRILSALDNLLLSHGYSKNDLRRVICTRGPGGYTGIRLALSIAGGLKRSLQIGAYGYPLFDVLLSGPDGKSKAAAIDAGREELLCCISDQKNGRSFFVNSDELPGTLKKHGIRKLLLASRNFAELEASLKSDIDILPASDNVLNMLYDFHITDESTEKNSLIPIYGREFVKGR